MYPASEAKLGIVAKNMVSTSQIQDTWLLNLLDLKTTP